MTLILCVENGGGITFNGRRVSKDIKIIENIFSNTDKLCVFAESRNMFERIGKATSLVSNFDDLRMNDTVFLEKDIPHDSPNLDELIIYRFNRDYPADVFLTYSPIANGLTLKSSIEFSGSSHEKITKEVYAK